MLQIVQKTCSLDAGDLLQDLLLASQTDKKVKRVEESTVSYYPTIASLRGPIVGRQMDLLCDLCGLPLDEAGQDEPVTHECYSSDPPA